MFGYIMVYVGGIATGVMLLVANRQSVIKAVEQEKRRSQANIERMKAENTRLLDELNMRNYNSAYNQGIAEGRKSPMTEAERFAESFEGKRVSFRSTANCKNS